MSAPGRKDGWGMTPLRLATLLERSWRTPGRRPGAIASGPQRRAWCAARLAAAQLGRDAATTERERRAWSRLAAAWSEHYDRELEGAIE